MDRFAEAMLYVAGIYLLEGASRMVLGLPERAADEPIGVHVFEAMNVIDRRARFFEETPPVQQLRMMQTRARS